jgi:hypothetical protein
VAQQDVAPTISSTPRRWSRRFIAMGAAVVVVMQAKPNLNAKAQRRQRAQRTLERTRKG